jgi:hypothetical protein
MELDFSAQGKDTNWELCKISGFHGGDYEEYRFL